MPACTALCKCGLKSAANCNTSEDEESFEIKNKVARAATKSTRKMTKTATRLADDLTSAAKSATELSKLAAKAATDDSKEVARAALKAAFKTQKEVAAAGKEAAKLVLGKSDLDEDENEDVSLDLSSLDELLAKYDADDLDLEEVTSGVLFKTPRRPPLKHATPLLPPQLLQLTLLHVLP